MTHRYAILIGAADARKCEMSKPSPFTRERAIEACAIANEFIGDLVAGTALCRWIEGVPLNETAKRQARRMLLFNLILTLAKWSELKRRYSDVIINDDVYKNLEQQLRDRKVHSARDKYVAHVLNKHTGSPLTQDQKEDLLHEVTRNDLQGFLSWINNLDQKQNTYPSTVVSIVERTRDSLRTCYNLSDQEIV